MRILHEKRSFSGYLVTVMLLLSLGSLTAGVERAEAVPAETLHLKNGLKVFYSPMRYLPVVGVSVLVRVSVMDEPAEKAGLANLVAELLTEGTEELSAEEFAETVEFLGLELSVSQQRDYAMISMKTLRKNLPKAMELLRQMLLKPAFLQKELDRKRQIIIDSLKQAEEEPSFVASRAFRKAVYGSHPYGRLVEGEIDSLRRITRDDVVGFYQRHYRPDNTIMAVAGDIDRDDLLRYLDDYFSGWIPAGREDTKRGAVEVTELKRPRLIVINRDLTQANIIVGHKGIKRSHPDYYAVSIMNYILGGGGFASRLMHEIRDNLGLAYDVHSFFSSNKDVGVFQVGVQTKNSSAKRVIEIILREMKKIQTEGVTEEELADAKAFLTGSFPRRIDTISKIANFLVLTDFFGLGTDYDMRYPELINAVTREDVLRVARRYLRPDAPVVVVVGKEKEMGELIGALGTLPAGTPVLPR